MLAEQQIDLVLGLPDLVFNGRNGFLRRVDQFLCLPYIEAGRHAACLALFGQIKRFLASLQRVLRDFERKSSSRSDRYWVATSATSVVTTALRPSSALNRLARAASVARRSFPQISISKESNYGTALPKLRSWFGNTSGAAESRHCGKAD